MLTAAGWQCLPEVTFSHFGERGSIDILAVHVASRTVLVVEIKTELTSVELTIRRLDAKTRLAAGIVEERFGWRPVRVGRLLIVESTMTNRRRIEHHHGVFAAAFPVRGQTARTWLKSPATAFSGLLFVSSIHPRGGSDRRISPKRIRVARNRRFVHEAPVSDGQGTSRMAPQTTTTPPVYS